MTGYGIALEMLADPTRRAILARLRRGDAAVGEIAAELPVSRPAVSKHLKLMKEAGIVRMYANGTRHLYRIDVRGLAEVRSYVEQFWDDALASFKEAAEQKEES
jgi:DNA-binding transcriptional ArsR family regulator